MTRRVITEGLAATPENMNARYVGSYVVGGGANDVEGDGTTDDRAALNTLANTTLSGVDATIDFTEGTYLIESNLTLPSNVVARLRKGAKLKPASGVTLTISGAFVDPGPVQVFDVSGGGAVAGLREAWAEWFGFSPTASAATNDAAIAATVASLASGGVLRMQRASYNLSQPVTIETSGLHIRAERGTELVSTYDGDVIYALGTNAAPLEDVSVEGLSFDLDPDLSNQRAVKFEHVRRGAVRDIRSTNPGNNAVSLYYCDEAVVTQSYLVADDYGVFVYRSRKVAVGGNHILDARRGIVVKGSFDTTGVGDYQNDAEVTIVGNTISGYSDYGIASADLADEGIVRGVVISGNTFANAPDGDYAVYVGPSGVGYAITGNTMVDCGGGGITLLPGGADHTVAGNTLRWEDITPTAPAIGANADNCTVSANTIVGSWRGVNMSDAVGGAIVGNSIVGFTNAGIIAGYSGGVAVAGVTVVGNSLRDASGTYAIDLGSTATDFVVSGNIAVDAGAIRTDGSGHQVGTNQVVFSSAPAVPSITVIGDDILVHGNLLNGGFRGIYVTGAARIVVSGNRIYGSLTSNGIHLYHGAAGVAPVADSLVTGNLVTGCTGFGIIEEGTAGTGNRITNNLSSGNTAGQFSMTSTTTVAALNAGQSLSAYTPTNVTTDRAYDADAVAVAELADVVGTLIADLKARGVVS